MAWIKGYATASRSFHGFFGAKQRPSSGSGDDGPRGLCQAEGRARSRVVSVEKRRIFGTAVWRGGCLNGACKLAPIVPSTYNLCRLGFSARTLGLIPIGLSQVTGAQSSPHN